MDIKTNCLWIFVKIIFVGGIISLALSSLFAVCGISLVQWVFIPIRELFLITELMCAMTTIPVELRCYTVFFLTWLTAIVGCILSVTSLLWKLAWSLLTLWKPDPGRECFLDFEGLLEYQVWSYFASFWIFIVITILQMKWDCIYLLK